MAYAEDPAYCEVCGERLVLREQPEDGPRPWCPRCEAWRYPHFSVGVSMIVYHPDGRRILTIDQYGKHGILVAGYVARGDDLESTVRREVREETGLELEAVAYNASRYFSPSNTLMANFVCRAKGSDVRPNAGEVDAAHWVDAAEVLDAMPEGSLARWFVQRHLESRGCGKL
ncbi:MAG: NAD(+) diphosphatase [Parafannyhessea sp.]|uniref:NAD(+) diphosphatase n=1 Tax=Parafannyhessea sp. TaxID=2847324 RepID=UPI003EFF7B3B